MTRDTTSDVVQALAEIVDQERQLILEGDFHGLSALAERKTAMIDRLATLGGPAAEPLAEIGRKAARNQELLNSAMIGIRQVQTRLAALRDVREGLRTYDANGRQQYADPPASTVERRA